MRADDQDDLTILGPTGKSYALAGAGLPLAEQVQHNYRVTGEYLRDVLETAIAQAPPEAVPLVIGQAVSHMLRSLPPPWLREFAYAGIVRRVEQLSDDSAEKFNGPGADSGPMALSDDR